MMNIVVTNVWNYWWWTKGVILFQVYVVQHTEITMVNAQFSKFVASLETREGCPITPGAAFTKQFFLVPLASSNKDRRGIALDGRLKVGISQIFYFFIFYSRNRREYRGVHVKNIKTFKAPSDKDFDLNDDDHMIKLLLRSIDKYWNDDNIT